MLHLGDRAKELGARSARRQNRVGDQVNASMRVRRASSGLGMIAELTSSKAPLSRGRRTEPPPAARSRSYLFSHGASATPAEAAQASEVHALSTSVRLGKRMVADSSSSSRPCRPRRGTRSARRCCPSREGSAGRGWGASCLPGHGGGQPSRPTSRHRAPSARAAGRLTILPPAAHCAGRMGLEPSVPQLSPTVTDALLRPAASRNENSCLSSWHVAAPVKLFGSLSTASSSWT